MNRRTTLGPLDNQLNSQGKRMSMGFGLGMPSLSQPAANSRKSLAADLGALSLNGPAAARYEIMIISVSTLIIFIVARVFVRVVLEPVMRRLKLRRTRGQFARSRGKWPPSRTLSTSLAKPTTIARLAQKYSRLQAPRIFSSSSSFSTTSLIRAMRGQRSVSRTKCRFCSRA